MSDFQNSRRPKGGTKAAPFIDSAKQALRLVPWLQRRRIRDDVRQTVELHFDKDYYLGKAPDDATVAADPIAHFLTMGWKEGRDPNDWFSVNGYLKHNSDVQVSGMNPFLHYLRFGKKEGRLTVRPDSADAESRDLLSENEIVEIETAIRPFFDADYYVRRYPDIVQNKVDPLRHYVVFGWKEGRDPAKWFATQTYLQNHEDVHEDRVNPLYHYVSVGKAEGRQIWPVTDTARRLIYNPKRSIVQDRALLDMCTFRKRPIVVADKSFDRKRLKIHWVIPDFQRGGGGHMTIFRIVRWLEFLGHECTIWINRPGPNRNFADARDEVTKWFQPVKADVLALDERFFAAEGDAVFATGWDTVWPVISASHFKERFYFVQDFEPLFFARGSTSLAAEQTYKQDIACICAGPWLRDLMQKQYGRWSRHFWLAAETELYHPAKSPERNRIPEIAFYSRTSTSRRAVELGFLALEELSRRGVMFVAHLFGSKLNFTEAPFHAVDHGILDASELADLYRKCDVGVCFSTTNYSLIPQEMMACGLAVVEVASECTAMVFPADAITMAEPDPIQIADALEALLKDRGKLSRQVEKANSWVGEFSWERAGRDVEAAVVERLLDKGYTARPDVETVSVPAAASGVLVGNQAHPAERPKVSIAIPTYNAGELFLKVIEAIRRQRAPWPFEIAVIDSSSSDGTAEYCRAQKDIQFLSIAQSEFSHGGTRNRLVEMTRGEFIAFLTQDALPANDFWLYELVSALEARPRAAGAFGHHFAWPTASAFTKRDLTAHFDNFELLPLAVSMETDRHLWQSSDIGWRQKLHFYSDNNSIMRRSVWERIPYAVIEFGEDQVWADEIIKAGYEKVYACRASVFHSHDYDARETEARCRTEAEFFNKHFGYRMVKGNVENLIARINATDEGWARSNSVPEAEIEERKILNRARIMGYVQGQSGTARKSPAS